MSSSRAVAQRQYAGVTGGASESLRQRIRGPHIARSSTFSLDAPHPITLTSPRCHSAWQLNPAQTLHLSSRKSFSDNRIQHLYVIYIGIYVSAAYTFNLNTSSDKPTPRKY